MHNMAHTITRPQRVLVSGAAGGLGVAVARRFTEDGARVALTDVNAEGLDRIAHEVGGIPLPADGRFRDQLAGVVSAATEALGGLDAVIAVQGAAFVSTTSAKTEHAWNQSLDVNLSGPFHLASEALPQLVESQGSLVMISSAAGIFAGPPGTAGYTAAKTGIVGLVRWLARQYGPSGVRVNAVCPGWIRTQLGEGGMGYLAQREGITVDEAYTLATRHVPLRRAAAPEEIANVCAFLTSSDAAFVTGTALVADGGGSAMDVGTAIFDE
jgi:meso-butanediol dehydrogenase/(S,S)-butanediol dehydrogenase/diacetyl reductase